MYFSLCSTTRQILRDAQNDKMIESSYFDTPSFFIKACKQPSQVSRTHKFLIINIPL